MVGCPDVEVQVDQVATATGWGAHFSLSPFSDGYGGSFVECHITGGDTSTGNVLFLCYDGVLSSSAHANEFEMPLGMRQEIDWVRFTLNGDGVAVQAQRRANNRYTTESIPYIVESYFPLRQSTGFCSGSTLHYREYGGVLNGRADRDGAGYALTFQ